MNKLPVSICTIQDPQNTCGKPRGTPIHMSVLYVSPDMGTRMICPYQLGSQTDKLSLTTSLFEYVVTSLSCGKYLIIYKLHIIYKQATIIY